VLKKGESVNYANEAGHSLQQITRAVQAITEINTLINDEAGSQSGVAVEINQNMASISQIASEAWMARKNQPGKPRACRPGK